jgi:non-ribosomal peptide synthetase component E (peptide arylation enzyme)
MNNFSDPIQFGPEIRMPGVVYPSTEDLKKYVEAGFLRKQTLIEGFIESHEKFADTPALIGPEGTFTHRQLNEITDRLAGALIDKGLKPLDRVVFQMPNCNELLFGFFGCLKAGLIPVCTLVSHREKEISYLAKHSGAVMHFVQGDDAKFDHVEFAQRMQTVAPSLKHILVGRGKVRPGTFSLKELIESQDPAVAKLKVQAVPRDPFQVVLFHLSGGTTGIPKIIPRFGAEYLYNMRAVAAFNGYKAGDIFYNPAPFMHNFNMVCCSGPTLLVGGTLAVAPTLDGPTVKHVLQKYKPNFLVLGGPILDKMAPSLLKNKKASAVFNAIPLLHKLLPKISNQLVDFRQVKGIFSTRGADFISRITGAPAFHVFGMTEGVIMNTCVADPEEARHFSVGRPVSALDQIKILKPGTEIEVALGEIGESTFKGPYTTHGYYDAADRNEEAFTTDGFYRSGDLMSAKLINGKIYYIFEGRIKDVIDRAGEKINAGEVEEAVKTHPAVETCAVIPVKDRAVGEKMCVCIVPRAGEAVPDVKALGFHLEKYGLAKFKWPERIEIVSELPVTHVGKIDKISLRHRFENSVTAQR